MEMFIRQYIRNNLGGTLKVFKFNNQNAINIFLLLIIVLTFLTTTCISSNQTQGEGLYEQALSMEKQKSFGQAASLHEQAFPVLLEENNLALATQCSEALQRLMIFQVVYPYTTNQLEEVIRQTFPQATAKQIESWITSKEIEHYIWDGIEHYFSDGIQNLKFRYIELIQSDEAAEQEYHNLVLKVNNIAQEQLVHPWQQYQKPATYRGIHTITIPRDKLPETGTYRLWLPIPINTGPQTQVTIESIIPDK
jgi:Na+-transporting NADH:ubiquinone oxidoreductase subunit NqrC